MKLIGVNGSSTLKKKRPATLNIPERVEQCINHFLENADKRFNYVPYVGVTLGEDPPHFVHHLLDWTEVLPYPIYGLVIARHITGSTKGTDIQQEQRKLFLSFFNEQDGLIHAPRSPWNDKYPLALWEQARALYAFLYWYQDSGDDNILDYMEHLVQGVFALSKQAGNQRVFSKCLLEQSGMGNIGVGALIDPLTKYYELTGNPKAFLLATGIAKFFLHPDHGYVLDNGEFRNWYRGFTAIINGLSRLAALTSDLVLLQKAKRLHDYAVSHCTSYGSTPCEEPACSNMELNMSALSLIRAGYEEYWDQIDRFIRNQTVEAQFLDPSEWVQDKAVKGQRIVTPKWKWVYQFYPNDLLLLPYDDYDNVVARSIGGFLWTTHQEHKFTPASLMLCCAAHALRSFQPPFLSNRLAGSIERNRERIASRSAL